MSECKAKRESGGPGPGYCSPEEAMKAPPEKMLFVTCIAMAEGKPDYLAVVDIEKGSSTFCQVSYL